MMQLDLAHLYSILDYSYQQRDRAPGESVCIVIVPPRDIADQINKAGKEGEDNSPAHCTVVYLGTVPLELESKVKTVAEAVCAHTKPFKVRLGGLNVFENEGEDVYHVQVMGKKLYDFRETLKHAFHMAQISVDAKHPDYKPHITLEYVEPGQPPKHIDGRPQGKWAVESAWLWGLSQPYLLQFR